MCHVFAIQHSRLHLHFFFLIEEHLFILLSSCYYDLKGFKRKMNNLQSQLYLICQNQKPITICKHY